MQLSSIRVSFLAIGILISFYGVTSSAVSNSNAGTNKAPVQSAVQQKTGGNGSSGKTQNSSGTMNLGTCFSVVESFCNDPKQQKTCSCTDENGNPKGYGCGCNPTTPSKVK